MFRLMDRITGGGKNCTFKPVKQHKEGSKRQEIHEYTKKTLGRYLTCIIFLSTDINNISGNMREVVRLPLGEDSNEWLAANSTLIHLVNFVHMNNLFLYFFLAVDFFNEISLIWGIVSESNLPALGPGQGFPPGYEYRWADGVKIRTAIRCSAVQYVEYVMTWIEEQINNEAIFPSSSGNNMCL